MKGKGKTKRSAPAPPYRNVRPRYAPAQPNLRDQPQSWPLTPEQLLRVHEWDDQKALLPDGTPTDGQWHLLEAEGWWSHKHFSKEACAVLRHLYLGVNNLK